jgi:PiT family inorganic phosphate transporter
MNTLVIVIIVLALGFDFLNGMNDAANSIATVVATKVLSPIMAVLWAAFFNFAAAFIFGVHVATTIGKGIVNPLVINEQLILAALMSAILWTFICTKLGLPISVSHSLIGGLIGAGLISHGVSSLVISGIVKIGIFIILSPLIGFILSYLFMILVLHLAKNAPSKKVDRYFRIFQLFSSAIFSLGHGSNDAQKTMGIIAVTLFSQGLLGNEFYIPTWVIFAAYSAIALGTLSGGWRVIQTLGSDLTDLKPIHGFCAETAGAGSVIMSTMLGIPVSTTHTITGAVIGVGVTRRLSAVKWITAGRIIWAWIFTIPATILVSALIYFILSFIL